MTVDRREVVVLDVNETLLDLRALAPRFEKLLPPALMGVWFSRMLRNSLVALATGQYAPFDRQGVDALLTTASSAGVEVTEAEAVELIAGMNELPPHPDVVPALGQLAGARIRMATLTNSALGVATAQVRNAGLESSSKPCCRSTRFAPSNRRRRLTGSPQRGVPVGSIRMVVAHDWDVTGAIRAGARAAFVARGGASLGPLSEIPDIVEPDLVAIDGAILKG